ncbi:hypothetical protein CK203_026104 [Vitis vinifera]|uniref:Reverse transcriptase Ty1/copia-type domain-containing protein n=1 Tax=Vitis vinifera TaxID=29760 RepID=A0A438IJ55_VITVI|nr:hypothetical protein CK203_026104 [Vitis vinifera]
MTRFKAREGTFGSKANNIDTVGSGLLQLILTKDDDDEMKRLKGAVATEFEIKDLGFLRYFLGMEVDTPMDPNLKLGEPDDSNPIYKGRY